MRGTLDPKTEPLTTSKEAERVGPAQEAQGARETRAWQEMAVVCGQLQDVPDSTSIQPELIVNHGFTLR